MKNRKYGLLVLLLAVISLSLISAREETSALPLVSVSLYSSGVGFYEHRGLISNNGIVELSFPSKDMDDVLKSLIILDGGSIAPSVTYEAGDTFYKTLESLRVNLGDSPDFAEIIHSLVGEEVLLGMAEPVRGRILGIDKDDQKTPVNFSSDKGTSVDYWISIISAGELRRFRLSEIDAFTFSDPVIAADLATALDLLKGNTGANRRLLKIRLPGTSTREISISYVISTPVWKATWRLALSPDHAFLQGWAIVDNTGNTDWTDISLSFLNGKPVSFVQPLYEPYEIVRPFVPLSIAGVARAQGYDSGYGSGNPEEEMELSYDADMFTQKSAVRGRPMAAPQMAEYAPTPALENSLVDTTVADRAGSLFRFTVKNAVSIPRRQSSMVPLVQGILKAEQFSVLSGTDMSGRGSIHPHFAVRLENTTGMGLPAGPVTVIENGSYAGDALLDFLPENEKRIISWGEDLSVTASIIATNSRITEAMRISGGVLTQIKKTLFETTYVVKNSDSVERNLLIEHPVRQKATLAESSGLLERTADLYRFKMSVPPNTERRLTVKESLPGEERIVLTRLGAENLLSWASSGDVPPEVRSALERAAALKKDTEQALAALATLESSLDRLFTTQDRIRQNLVAAGSDSAQGRDYLSRLSASESEIDRIEQKILEARKNADKKQTEFFKYLSGLSLK